MLDTLEKYKEVAQFLKEDTSRYNIDLMEEAIEEKKFLLSFVGQFSAGKSKLINNIIGKEVLPVHISETTQVVTFIKYGEEEHGIIAYKDLTTEEVTIDKIKEIWQGQTDDILSNFKEIDHIEVFIKSLFLSNGLIIADTPGVNTTIREHEKITHSVLKASEEIIYVISKPLTDVDKSFIKQILQMGLKTSCVRTFMDRIKSSEENSEESVLTDRKVISELAEEREIKIYHVSNEGNNEWFEKINDIREYISTELSRGVSENINESCRLRLNKISENLLTQLEEKKEALSKIINGDMEEFDKKREEDEKVLHKLKEKLEAEKRNSEIQITEVKNEAKKELEDMKGHVLRNGKRALEDVIYSRDAEEILKNTAFKNINDSYVKLQESYVREFNEIISEKSNEIRKELENSNIKMSLNLEQAIPSGISEIAITIDEEDSEVEKIKRNIMALANGIEEKEKRLQEFNISKEEYEQQSEEIYEIVRQIEEEISKQGNYECKFVVSEDQPMQPSEVLRRIGNGLDWAACLIPGKAYTKIAGKVGKYCKVAGKAIEAYKKVDTTKDILFTLQNISKTTRTTKKGTEKVLDTVNKSKEIADKAGLLDMLTFQYWFEKVGSNFDSPLKMEVDKEYEKRYNDERARLMNQYNNAKTAEIEKLQALGIIKNEEQKLKRMKEIDDRRNEELIEELKMREDEIRKAAFNNAFNKLKNDYCNWFEVKIESLCKLIEEKCDEILKDALLNYTERCTANISYEINKSTENNYELLKRFNESGIKETKEELNLCEEYMDYLRRI